jgi:hypothetical protein
MDRLPPCRRHHTLFVILRAPGVEFLQRRLFSILFINYLMPNLKRRPRARDAPKHAGASAGGDTATQTQT